MKHNKCKGLAPSPPIRAGSPFACICGFRSPLRHLAASKRQYQGPVACAALRSHISHRLMRSSPVRLPERPPPERPAGSGALLAAPHTLRTDPARPPPRLQAPPRPVLVRLNPAPVLGTARRPCPTAARATRRGRVDGEIDRGWIAWATCDHGLRGSCDECQRGSAIGDVRFPVGPLGCLGGDTV